MFKKRNRKEGGTPATKSSYKESQLDPIIGKVQEHLEENLQYFLSNISTFVDKYNKRIETVLPKNPKMSDHDLTLEPLTPLRKKTRADGAAAASTPSSRQASTAFPAGSPKTAQPGTPSSATIATDGTAPALPDNSDLLAEMKILKGEAYELSTIFDGMHDWVALNIPDIKEEDNAGVEIQGAVLEQTEELASVLRNVYSLELKYLADRSELETTLLKYPKALSLPRAISVIDCNAWDDIERSWRTMIRICILVYALFQKNMSRLKEPRTKAINIFT